MSMSFIILFTQILVTLVKVSSDKLVLHCNELNIARYISRMLNVYTWQTSVTYPIFNTGLLSRLAIIFATFKFCLNYEFGVHIIAVKGNTMCCVVYKCCVKCQKAILVC